MIKTLRGTPECIDIMNDNDILVMGGTNSILTFQSLKYNKLLLSFPHCVFRIKCSPTQRIVVLGFVSGRITLYNVDTFTEEELHYYIPDIRNMSFSSDGNLLAYFTEKESFVRCLKTKDVIYRIENGGLFGRVFSQSLILATLNGTVKHFQWDNKTEETNLTLKNINLEINANLYYVAMSPNDSLVAVGGSTAQVWDLQSNRQVCWLDNGNKIVHCLTFSPDGQTVALGCSDFVIRLCCADNGKCFEKLFGHTNRIFSIVFSPRGHNIVSSASRLVFVPQGFYMVAEENDHNVIVWSWLNKEHFSLLALILAKNNVANYVIVRILDQILGNVKQISLIAETEFSAKRKQILVAALRQVFFS